MTIPLDRLYNFLDGVSDHSVIIYRFWPHGSKKLEDIEILRTAGLKEHLFNPIMICHDQEPLDFELYNNTDANVQSLLTVKKRYNLNSLRWDDDIIKRFRAHQNLESMIMNPSLFDRTLLCHSEQRSSQLELYEQHNFAGVYYWSHALIARDWFRYAHIDPALSQENKTVKQDFLIYNRAWTGSREYRLRFAEMLVQKNLHHNCDLKFNPHDNGVCYLDHQYKNSKFRISTCLEEYLPINNFVSGSSADYVAQDYQSTAIEVVLETLFDDDRLHLTEKSLRPIACAQPFMLMATANSLEYLRSYGFKTFTGLIDESYDLIHNPIDRMQAIVVEMQRISAMPSNEKKQLYYNLNNIAKQNQQRFFSKQFHQQVVKEYQINLDHALSETKKHVGQNYRNFRKMVQQQFPHFRDEMLCKNSPETKQLLVQALVWAHKQNNP